MILVKSFIFLIANILNFCFSQFLPSSINSIQPGQGQNEKLPRNFDFNPFNIQKNDPIGAGNNYYPQFSPNTPFINQETLFNGKYNPIGKTNFFEPSLNLHGSQDDSSKNDDKEYNIYKNNVHDHKDDILSMKANILSDNNYNLTKNINVNEKDFENRSFDLEENKSIPSKNLTGFFPYEFEKDYKLKNETQFMKKKDMPNSGFHLPYKPLFPIFNKKNLEEIPSGEKNNFPVPSKFNSLPVPVNEQNVVKKYDNDITGVNNEIKNFKSTNYEKNIVEKKVNNLNINENNKTLSNDLFGVEESHDIKPNKSGIPGFPPFPFGDSFNPPNMKTNYPPPGSSPFTSPQNKNGPPNFVNFPNFPQFNFNNINNPFSNTFLQPSKNDQSKFTTRN
ncbi:Hypothetical protein SRAE_0000037100 [Strongyloides ratti]|uniref:Uncharacterized protein n=1 Tax=Strongyloides ratti TaxID=34506 RepID=A0A090KUS9_STRRB|nr:Hypothetical protein SRAE_0000037100 [Strongyloides ratti]CEF61245.1 Hypothetical protein SRAE_0000037100 [Strongyloides ratti]